MKKPWPSILLYGVACLPAALVAIDFAHRSIEQKKASAPPTPQMIPRDVLLPETASYELTPAELKAFKEQPPLEIGARAPRLEATDFQGRKVQIPAPDGKPTVWVVTDGGLRGAGALHELVKLHERVGDQVHIAAFVTTHSEYIWGHHGSSFWLTPLLMVQDEHGTYFQKCRPPGDAPASLPAVYGCDGDGIIRYVSQPTATGSWGLAADVQKKMALKSVVPRNRA